MPAVFAQEAAASGGAASAIGWTIAGILILGFVIAILVNVRRGKAEVGAEIELAANRKPYLSDEELEGRKLDRTLGAGLLLLALISVAVPMYWLYEPARQQGAIEMFREEAIRRGEEVYEVKAKCVECHGPKAVGGAKETPLLNANGQFIANVKWQAPALDTVLYRYTREEIMFILNYGRPFSPMPAWGAPGGGPLTEQQLENVITYLESIQLPADKSKIEVDKEIQKVCAPDAAGKCTINDPNSPDGSVRYATLGEALFNLGLYDGFAGGAYSCGRCHTKGWSYGRPEQSGGGSMGPNLTNGSELRQFDTADLQIQFVSQGAPLGKKYGNSGLGSGKMPAFGDNREAAVKGSTLMPDQVMLTQDQIAAIVEYERSL